MDNKELVKYKDSITTVAESDSELIFSVNGEDKIEIIFHAFLKNSKNTVNVLLKSMVNMFDTNETIEEVLNFIDRGGKLTVIALDSEMINISKSVFLNKLKNRYPIYLEKITLKSAVLDKDLLSYFFTSDDNRFLVQIDGRNCLFSFNKTDKTNNLNDFFTILSNKSETLV